MKTAVKVKKKKIRKWDVRRGVPQGSVLALIMFLV